MSPDLAETVKRLRELAAKATPGGWTATDQVFVYAGDAALARTFDFGKHAARARANAAYIAAANPAVISSILDALEGLERAVGEARANERNRCAAIVQAARMGEVDRDLRTLNHMILGGCSIEEIKDILK